MKLRLQYKLSLTFFFLFILPVVIIGIFLLFSFKRVLENNLYSYQEITLQQLQSELDKYCINLHRIAQTLSYDIPFTLELAKKKEVMGDPQRWADHERKIHQTIQELLVAEPSVLGYCLYTDRENVFASDNLASISKEGRLLPESLLSRIRQGEQIIALSKPLRYFAPENSPLPPLLFASRINITYLQEKSIEKGVLVLMIDRNYLDGVFQRHNQMANDLFLFNSDGDHIYSSSRSISFKTLPGELIKSLREKRNGRYTISSNSRDSLVSFTTSRFNSIKLLGFSSDERIRNDLFFLSQITLIFLFILLSFFFLFTIYLSWSISFPVNQLERIIDKLERSGFNDTDTLKNIKTSGILSPYFDPLFRFLHTVIFRINDYHKKEKEQELMILQAQINPHFVYNTLNTIRIMADMEGKKDLAKAIQSLIHLLRNSIKIGVIFISIKEEVDQIKDYIALQQLRYRNSFQVRFLLDKNAMSFRCIKFILQPIVENAIFHGLDTNSPGGFIQISISKQDDRIHYSVEDNGRGMEPEELATILEGNPSEGESDKIGLKNVNSRLASYFGEDSKMRISSEKDRGTTVTYSLPTESHVP